MSGGSKFKTLSVWYIKLIHFIHCHLKGADVNGGNHEHDYSPLHFAALANKEQICQVLIENGAKIDAVNSVKRTASQMAAFVGNSKCVAVINNYVPKEDVFYFTRSVITMDLNYFFPMPCFDSRKQPLEEKAKMPLKLAKPLHELVMITNTNPVRIGLELKARPELLELENLEKMCQILELMSDREFKDRRDVNEVLSLKFHIIHYIVKDIKKQTEKEVRQEKQMKLPLIDRWIKSMLLARESDGYQVFQEDFLRQGVKEFPYKESTLFKTLVTNFSQSRNYGESLTASDFINQAFNGQKGFNDDDSCGACGNEKTEKKCSKCKSKNYCDQNCQKLHWFVHKKFCN